MLPASSHVHRQNIRRQLRREEIQTYFETRRQQLLAASTQMPSTRDLTGRVERGAFLREMVGVVQGEEWRWGVEELRRSLCSFGGCLEEWVGEGVIDCLCECLKSKEGLNDLQWRVSELLAEAVGQQRGELTVVVELMNRGVVENVVCLLRSKYFALEERGAFFYLLGTLSKCSNKIRSFAVKMGADDLLHAYGEELLAVPAQEYLLYNFAGYCELFLTIIRTQSHVYLPDIHSVPPSPRRLPNSSPTSSSSSAPAPAPAPRPSR